MNANNTPLSAALAASIDAHKAAAIALQQYLDSDAVAPMTVGEAEARAFEALALTPCAPAEFDTKMRYMLAHQKACYGDQWCFECADVVMRALDLHLTGDADAKAA